ncbi:hypothetical protein [Pseudoduganella albidiflava]|uniref:Uncharacterized protein n=1 Tax=Pseudoduganella albidiflava TaxID=321983 RepID=A0A411WY08_9BURK|nr:hypothetical protein [Pseudoduganella albidiflava]QBI01580.1 hypothetical protein EYF70_12500 [Pseudoduganella albidiflava]GGY34577.1 hypothetical protein GCM10007387_15660 [Pseudoduganella albidiflava]
MTRQDLHRCVKDTGAPPNHGGAYRPKGDAEFDAATLALCNASDETFSRHSTHPPPVHARNTRLSSAWKEWPAIHASVFDSSLAMRTIDTSSSFSENEAVFKMLFHRCRTAGYAAPANLERCLKGMAALATAASMYWLRPHALFELTPTVKQLLASSDPGADIPVSQLRPPFPACFIRFGTELQPVVTLAEDIDQRVTGAYVFEAVNDGRRAITILSIFEYGDGRTQGGATTSIVIENENDSVLDVLRDVHLEPGLSETVHSQQLAIAQVCGKVFLYWSMANARRLEQAPLGAAMARLRAVGPKKAARLRRLAAELYDRIVFGPVALPSLLQAGRGDVAPHWRNGHFRMQPYGPQSTLRKVVFIAPTLVRADRLVECQTAARQENAGQCVPVACLRN